MCSRRVGLRDVAGQRVGGFSLGMGQRLGVASALLGNPKTVVLDEPVNGLDPEGVRWMRTMLKHLAADGHTVLVSSPPDERDGANRNTCGGHRPGSADRRYLEEAFMTLTNDSVVPLRDHLSRGRDAMPTR